MCLFKEECEKQLCNPAHREARRNETQSEPTGKAKDDAALKGEGGLSFCFYFFFSLERNMMALRCSVNVGGKGRWEINTLSTPSHGVLRKKSKKSPKRPQKVCRNEILFQKLETKWGGQRNI